MHAESPTMTDSKPILRILIKSENYAQLMSLFIMQIQCTPDDPLFPFCLVTGEVVATTVQDAESSNSIQYATYRYVLVVINEVYSFSCIVISRHFLASAFFLPLVAGSVAQRRNAIRELKVFFRLLYIVDGKFRVLITSIGSMKFFSLFD